LTELPKTLRCVYADQPSLTTTSEKSKKKKQEWCVANGRMLDYLMKRPESREWVVRFAQDKALWEETFESAFEKMLESNFKKLRVFVTPSASLSTEGAAE
jgi:hypothetical protein